jgi:hypothetical protein
MPLGGPSGDTKRALALGIGQRDAMGPVAVGMVMPLAAGLGKRRGAAAATDEPEPAAGPRVTA